MNLQLTGMHHVSAISSDIQASHDFYTGVLGMRPLIKTVNQDDPSMYHLFFGDGAGTPGSDLTIFDIPHAIRDRRGNNSISLTTFRVSGAGALAYWVDRFDELGVSRGEISAARRTAGARLRRPRRDATLPGRRWRRGEGVTWDESPVPAEYQIRGLGYTVITIPRAGANRPLSDRSAGSAPRPRLPTGRAPGTYQTHVYVIGEGGPHAEVHVIVRDDLPRARQGAGGVHHVALRVPAGADDAEWVGRGWTAWATATAAWSTGTTSSPATSASRTACSSSWPPTAPASRWTARWTARSSPCPPSWSRTAPRSRHACSRWRRRRCDRRTGVHSPFAPLRRPVGAVGQQARDEAVEVIDGERQAADPEFVHRSLLRPSSDRFRRVVLVQLDPSVAGPGRRPDAHRTGPRGGVEGSVRRVPARAQPTEPAKRSGRSSSPTDYLTYVDGKLRLDGVRSFLASRGIVLPEGSDDDAPTATVHGVGRQKNELLLSCSARRGVDVYEGSVHFVEAVRDAGLRARGGVGQQELPGGPAGRRHRIALRDPCRRRRRRARRPARQTRAGHVPGRGRGRSV